MKKLALATLLLWPTVLAFASALLLGTTLGLLSPITPAAREWNWFAIRRRPLPE